MQQTTCTPTTKQIDKCLDALETQDIAIQHEVSMLRMHVTQNIINVVPVRTGIRAAMNLATSKTLQYANMR